MRDEMAIYECPYKYKRINPETGLEHTNVDNANHDEKSEKRYCNTGPGPWCGQCQHFKQAKVSNEKWKQIFDRMKTDGRAPHLFQKINADRAVDPLGLRVSHVRKGVKS